MKFGEALKILNVEHIDPDLSVKAFFIALVFAGAGGTANLFYTFYLRDKNIGMGARLPGMQNPLRGRSETVPATGFLFAETDENNSRFNACGTMSKKTKSSFSGS